MFQSNRALFLVFSDAKSDVTSDQIENCSENTDCLSTSQTEIDSSNSDTPADISDSVITNHNSVNTVSGQEDDDVCKICGRDIDTEDVDTTSESPEDRTAQLPCDGDSPKSIEDVENAPVFDKSQQSEIDENRNHYLEPQEVGQGDERCERECSDAESSTKFDVKNKISLEMFSSEVDNFNCNSNADECGSLELHCENDGEEVESKLASSFGKTEEETEVGTESCCEPSDMSVVQCQEPSPVESETCELYDSSLIENVVEPSTPVADKCDVLCNPDLSNDSLAKVSADLETMTVSDNSVPSLSESADELSCADDNILSGNSCDAAAKVNAGELPADSIIVSAEDDVDEKLVDENVPNSECVEKSCVTITTAEDELSPVSDDQLAHIINDVDLCNPSCVENSPSKSSENEDTTTLSYADALIASIPAFTEFQEKFGHEEEDSNLKGGTFRFSRCLSRFYVQKIK